MAFLPSFPDPEEYYALFYSKSAPEINLTGYRNQEYDDIFEASMIEQNLSKRMGLFIQLEAILKRDVPLIYLNHGNPTMYFVPRFIHGLHIRFVIPDYSEVWIEKLNESTK